MSDDWGDEYDEEYDEGGEDEEGLEGGDASEELSSLPTLKVRQALPSDAAAYGSVNFWDERYMTSGDPFDWYHPYVVIRDLIRDFVKLSDNILILGCGNSRLGEDMVYDGYFRITNLDWSGVLIELLQEEYSDIPELTWVKGNATAMEFPDCTFDVVIDKATLDSVLCSMQPMFDMRKMLNEVERVLKPEGRYICMSVGTPDMRLESLEDTDPESEHFLSWEVAVHAVPKSPVDRFEMVDLNDMGNYYYLYLCSKSADLWESKLVKLGKLKRKKKKKPKEVSITSSSSSSKPASVTVSQPSDST